MINLSEQLRNLNDYPNKIGRYSTTKIHNIITGRLTPELYLNPANEPLKTIWKNFELGRAKHEIIEKCIKLKYPDIDTEKKIEYNITDEIVLVGKYDILLEGILLEIKTSENLKTELNDWNISQGKIYCSLFDKPKCEFFQPIFWKEKNRIQFGLNKFGEVLRDEKYFELVKEKIIKFHEDLKSI